MYANLGHVRINTLYSLEYFPGYLSTELWIQIKVGTTVYCACSCCNTLMSACIYIAFAIFAADFYR